MSGQYIIQTVGAALDEYLNKVCGTKDRVYSFYSDTDACYITLDPLVQKFYKDQPKEKIVAKLKYAKTNEPLKLVSINPTDIVGAQELWVYNTKSRKLGKYVADEFKELSVKGTSITGYNEFKSVQKTLRKPEDQLKEFKAAGKVALRKFLDDIKAVDIKLNGRINEEIVILKVQ
jgi:hypothetical protein